MFCCFIGNEWMKNSWTNFFIFPFEKFALLGRGVAEANLSIYFYDDDILRENSEFSQASCDIRSLR